MPATAADYRTDITRRPARSGRMTRGEYTVTITTPAGEVITPELEFWTAEQAQEYADKRIAALADPAATKKAERRRAQLAALKAERQTTTTKAAPATTPVRRDRQADRVARLTGLPATTATGRCHYCNQPLGRDGRCAECV